MDMGRDPLERNAVKYLVITVTSDEDGTSKSEDPAEELTALVASIGQVVVCCSVLYQHTPLTHNALSVISGGPQGGSRWPCCVSRVGVRVQRNLPRPARV